MKLVGYIKEFREFSFAVPIYSEGKNFYHHSLDAQLRITHFTEVDEEVSPIVPLEFSTEFIKGSIGAVVFVGRSGYRLYDEAKNIADKIIKYLKDVTGIDEMKFIKKEAESLKSYFVDHLVNLDQDCLSEDDKLLKITQEIKELTVHDPIFLHVQLSDEKEYHTTKLSILPLTERDRDRIILYSQQIEMCYDEDAMRVDRSLERDFFAEVTDQELIEKRAEERKKKLREYNYKFHVQINQIDSLKNKDNQDLKVD